MCNSLNKISMRAAEPKMCNSLNNIVMRAAHKETVECTLGDN